MGIIQNIVYKLNRNEINLNGTRKMDILTCIKSLESKGCFAYREIEILNDLTEVAKKKDAPSNYLIYEFYNSKGEGFEAGYTPNGMGITN